MGLTVTHYLWHQNKGDVDEAIYTLACDNSYPTGGYPLTPAQLGFSTANAPDLKIELLNNYGYGWRYDYTNHKLLFYSSAGVQVTNGTDLSALTDVRLSASSAYRSYT